MPDTNPKFTSAVGRRKEAIARVRLFKGHSPILINDKPISEYFRGQVFQKLYQRPFELTNTLGQYSATIKVLGGGSKSQLDAVVHGISKALHLEDKDNFHTPLKKAGFLTRDARVRERRKYGHAHSARSMKQSPKR